MRSYAIQEIGLLPTQHRGPGVTGLWNRGDQSDVLDDRSSTEEERRELIEVDPGAILDRLTRQNSTFGRADIAKSLATYFDDIEDIERLLAGLLKHPKLAVLRPELRFDDAATAVVDAVYSTKAMVKLERQMADQASELSGGTGF